MEPGTIPSQQTELDYNATVTTFEQRYTSLKKEQSDLRKGLSQVEEKMTDLEHEMAEHKQAQQQSHVQLEQRVTERLDVQGEKGNETHI